MGAPDDETQCVGVLGPERLFPAPGSERSVRALPAYDARNRGYGRLGSGFVPVVFDYNHPFIQHFVDIVLAVQRIVKIYVLGGE